MKNWMSAMPFVSVFRESWDVVVFGGGYAGFAAAVKLHRLGRKVLLVERQAAILWEGGWAFAADAGSSAHPLWQEWVEVLAQRHGGDGKSIDGAVSEVLASKMLIDHRLAVLYYAAPIAAERESALLDAVILGTKSGPRRLAARQWIDATETGELANLLRDATALPSPRRRVLNLYFRSLKWPDSTSHLVQCAELPNTTLVLEPTLWPSERRLRIELPGDFARPRSAWIPALTALHGQFPQDMEGAVLTHGSVLPFDLYAPDTDAAPAAAAFPANVAVAVPALSGQRVETLANRFDLGTAAARSLPQRPRAAGRLGTFAAPIDLHKFDFPAEKAQVAVAGVGTGGAVAAIAAGRGGVDVVAFDPLPFAGGIGAGGGIHWYYYGVKGGLQEEIDDRIRAITPLFGKMQQVAGFHPDAKKCVLDQMFQEAGVRDIPGAMLVDVELAPSNDPALQRVASTVLATARGPLRLSADAWIDSTGDGDLGSANKAYSLGRQGDGMFHAYTQSSGRGIVEKDQSKLTFFNYDSGFVDPTDVEDLTRARLTGIGQYVQEDFTEIEHPTYIAFALGLRQGRHVETDYLLQLSDLIERRTFPDSVGLTGCHYDNHAGDYEFESDEAMFWVWVCRQWWGRTACEFPYRMLLPKGLANVWMACRALGVSVDAHHSFRMQRDMQRVGEVAGIAAALSVPVHGESRRIPFPKLREKLIETGAISHKASEATDQFGPNTLMDSVHEGAVAAVSDEQMKAWLAEMENSPPGAFLWHLYRHERACRPQVEALLQSPKNAVTWKAATVLAIWSDPRAEPRLIEAIRAREYGYDEATKPEEKPEQWTRAAPNWLVAVNLLRRCGTAACLQPLFELSGDATLLLNQRTAIGITCESLAQRLKLSEQEKNVIVEILRRLLSTPAPNSRTMIHKNLVTPTEVTAETGPTARPPVVEDFTWQLHLAVAKSLHAAGLPLQPEAKGFLVDSRAIVRRAFGTLDQNF